MTILEIPWQLIPVLILCDVIRGGWKPFDKGYKPFRKVLTFGYGAILGFMITCGAQPCNLYLIAACSVLWWLGEKPSWRKLFNELSWKVPEGDYLFPRFMLRGLIWAAPCLPLAYWNINFLLLAGMSLAFPLSAYWGYRYQDWFDEHTFTETSRPTILGVIICVGLQATS